MPQQEALISVCWLALMIGQHWSEVIVLVSSLGFIDEELRVDDRCRRNRSFDH